MGRERNKSRASPVAPIFLTLLTVLAASAVVLAAQGIVTSLNQASGRTITNTLTTKVSKTEVIQSVQGEVSVAPEFSRELKTIVPSGAQPIYTRSGLGAGATATLGNVLAVVAERPVFALRGAVPAYRMLGPGAVGTDVVQLQASLREMGYKVSDKEGVYGPTTAVAMSQLYESNKFVSTDIAGVPVTHSTRRDTGVPFGEVQFFPAFPLTAQSPCGEQGKATLDVMCTVVGGTPSMRIAVADVDAASIRAGMPVKIQLSDGTPLEATLGELIAVASVEAAVSDNGASKDTVQPTGSGTTSFAVTNPKETVVSLGQQGSAVVVIAVSTGDALSVESVAVQSKSGGKSWLVSSRGEKIDVTLGLCSDGFCVVSGNGVVDGLTVKLSNIGSTPAK